MAGTAFREQTNTDLFGFNTWTLTSDPRKMPGVIKTYEGHLIGIQQRILIYEEITFYKI